ncbi:zinc finger protein CONSTANS-LIKE 9-like [Andrographis paniculata]|uniref:zinc finger protein CONSTANS-LIKE 9-like n=1 Tax=Andrographis paniculata TaxID=175694 RepID=UPI0021E8E78A|nr:zinc finger protein CONSTANS-LIKE 9-like [Andrographis paniculata]
MAKKDCELCCKAARMFCESDQASLCWECDEKVHAANFLVAKHSRTLLCHVCRSPTPWRAAGPRLGPTVSVCHACALQGETPPPDGNEDASDSRERESEIDGEVIYSDSEGDEEEEEEEEEEEDEDEEEMEEDGENQVVPWSAAVFDSPPPQASSSGSDENVSISASSSKRSRENYPHESSEDEEGCCSSQDTYSKLLCTAESAVEESPGGFSRPLKTRRTGTPPPAEASGEPSPAEGTPAIVEKLRRFQREIGAEGAAAADTATIVLSLSKFTRDE